VSGFSGNFNENGKLTNTPADGYDHLMDAMRYALTDILGGDRWGF
jgi:hypothetical protein